MKVTKEYKLLLKHFHEDIDEDLNKIIRKLWSPDFLEPLKIKTLKLYHGYISDHSSMSVDHKIKLFCKLKKIKNNLKKVV